MTRVLADAVRVVRTVRPLVVNSVFVGGPTDGHGNHATAGLLAQEVFKAAGDPKMFPEQIREGLLPWTPVKEYARVPQFRTSDKGAYDYATHHWGPVGVQNYITGRWEPGAVSTTVAVPVGTYDSMLGLTYLQVSREGLGFQKSQNGGTDIPAPAEQVSNYHRFGSHIRAQDKEASFFDGIDISLAGIADLAGPAPPDFLKDGLRQINGAVESAIAGFSAQDPSAIAGTLAKGLKTTDALVAEVEKSSLTAEEKYNVLHELKEKRQQFNQALLASLGVSLEADIVPAAGSDGAPSEFGGARETFQMAVPGQNIHVGVHLFDGGKLPVEIEDVKLNAASGKSWSVKPETGAPQANRIRQGPGCPFRGNRSGRRTLHPALFHAAGYGAVPLRPRKRCRPEPAIGALPARGDGASSLRRRHLGGGGHRAGGQQGHRSWNLAISHAGRPARLRDDQSQRRDHPARADVVSGQRAPAQ